MPAIESATTCVAMCQPSASSAIDPVSQPATISATIVAAVIATTIQVRRSPARLPGSKACSWRKPLRSWIAMASILGEWNVTSRMHLPLLLAALAAAPAPMDHSHHAHHGEGALQWRFGEWSVMAHGFVNAIHDKQGGPRGDTKDFSNSMFMAVA